MKYCKACGKVSAFEETSAMEAGSYITITKCGNCGKEERTTKKFIHYGDDSRGK